LPEQSASKRPCIFWDSSGLLAAVMSPRDNSPGRLLLKLGEAGLVDMRLSREVLGDCERVLRRGDTQRVKQLAVLIDRANIAISLDPNDDTIEVCAQMTGYMPDARVLAAAVECSADVFVTHDREHFLENPLISPPDTNIRVLTVRESLEWCREQLARAFEEP
jgi:predicted nucleic acid-binding protein